MDKDIRQTTQTDMDSLVPKFEVAPQTTDNEQPSKEQHYDNEYFTKWYGYYKERPMLKKAIDSFATWVLGKGFTTDTRTQLTLENINGRGEEDFLSILWNMKVVSKINGDSYAEIVRGDDGRLINLKPLNPEKIRIVFNKQGLIIRYEQRNKVKNGVDVQTFTPDKILHLSNDRTADELGGTSVVPVVQWSIDARAEAMEGYRRILHRSTIRVLHIDEDDKTRLANLKKDYAEAIKNGELLILPALPKDSTFEDLSTPPVQSFLEWIRYLENFTYIAVGIPKVIMGSVDSIPESGGKISYLTYEQIYSRETRQLEADLWSQLAIKVKFNPPASIAEGVADEKSNAQTGFQPNDTQAGVGK